MKVHWIEAGHAVAVRGTLLIQVWEWVMPDQARMERISRLLEQLPASPRPNMLAIVAVGSPMPDSGARRVAATFPKHFGYYVGVHEGSGFRAAMGRAVITGMNTLSGLRANFDLCSTVEEGARLLGKRDAKLDLASLVEDVQALREQIAAAGERPL